MMEGYCGKAGSRGKTVTRDVICAIFEWDGRRKDIGEFTEEFIHCIVSRLAEKMPRPLAMALYGKKPKEIVHLDSLYMGNIDEKNMKYKLVLKDDLSAYFWLMQYVNPDREATKNGLVKWIASYGGMI